MSKIVRVLGIDAAFANMGFAWADVECSGTPRILDCTGLALVKTEKDTHKAVRASSSHLRRAQELHAAVEQAQKGAHFVFAEIPSGAQSAAAAFAFGVATGILASIPEHKLIQVQPMEVKTAVSGKRDRKGPTKAAIIAWAHERWTLAPWLYHQGRLVQANEHLADAMAIITAGLQTSEFQRAAAMIPEAAAERAILAPRRRVRV